MKCRSIVMFAGGLRELEYAAVSFGFVLSGMARFREDLNDSALS